MKFSLDSHKLHHHLDRVVEFKNSGDCAPIYIEVSPSGSCNHRCIFCAYDYIAYPNRFLEINAFKKFTNDIKKSGLKSMLFAGEGEPLLHPKIDEMVNFAYSCGLSCAMFSNGAKLNKELAKAVLPHLEFIRFSFNAGDGSTYKKIHKANDFAKAVENIASACRLRKECSYNLDIGSQFVLLNENKDSLVSAVKTMKECGVDYISIKPFNLQNSEQGYKNLNAINTKQINELYNEAKSYESDDFKVFFRQNAFNNNINEREYRHCYGCSFITCLNSAGDLATCLPFWDKKDFVYGNIYEQSFEQIWNGEKRVKIKRFLECDLNAKKCPPNCRPNAINEFLNEIMQANVKHINFV